ncbi:MAG: YfiR family protein [Chitinophagaceae bacterium]|nr:YfiR family protein [Chitinophagaceae bacterium]
MRTGKPHIITHRIGLRKNIASLVAAFMLVAGAPDAQAQASREGAIKAVFLFNFSQFVEWPQQTFSSPSAPFVIGILGDDPFGPYLDETIEGEKVNGHKLVVQRFRDVKDIKSCHILFINQRDADYRDLLGALAGHNILTVSDGRGFTRSGGMVRFSTENNKIKLEINPDAAKQEGLVISSKLLRIATIFDPTNRGQ